MNDIAYLLISALIAVSTFAAMMGLRVRMTSRRLALVSVAPGAPVVPTARSVALAQSWRERILKPTLRALHRTGITLTPNRNIEQLQNQLMLAGKLDSLTIIDFLGMRILAAAGVAALVFSFAIMSKPWPSAMLFAVAGFAVGLYLPNFWLKSQISKRQKAITRALPDTLDRMSICVDAGLGFEAAIQKVATQGKNELAAELRRVMGEIRLGVARVDALHHLVDRTGVADIASFVAVLVQADQLGLAIRDVLHTQSVQMRVRRRQRAEEAAQKAPIKMLIPLVLFIFPTVFAVILGPAIPRILSAFQ